MRGNHGSYVTEFWDEMNQHSNARYKQAGDHVLEMSVDHRGERATLKAWRHERHGEAREDETEYTHSWVKAADVTDEISTIEQLYDETRSDSDVESIGVDDW